MESASNNVNPLWAQKGVTSNERTRTEVNTTRKNDAAAGSRGPCAKMALAQTATPVQSHQRRDGTAPHYALIGGMTGVPAAMLYLIFMAS